jgi:putative aldouronate transport system substrate-binding protein
MTLKRSIFASAIALVLAGCSTGDLSDAGAIESDTDTVESTDTTEQTMELSDNLDIVYNIDDSLATLTYPHNTPLELPDGQVITTGDLKPIWQHWGDTLGFQINDAAIQDQTTEEMIELQAVNGFSEATVYGGAAALDFIRYGDEGYFVDLNERLDDMPNVQTYFEEYPAVKEELETPDGSMYYLPYSQPIDTASRVFMSRESWHTALLDGTDQLEDETETLDVVYEGYQLDRHDQNVVELQNAAAEGGTLTRDVALNTLIEYINETYPDLETPSDLYLGEGAQYDIDELIAFWRVVKLSPNTLSKVSTGEVVEGATTVPFYTQTSRNYHAQTILKLAYYLGGFGVDYNSMHYVNEDGELTFPFDEDRNLQAYSYLRDIYAEGLIYEEVENENNTENFRVQLFSSDDNPGITTFGMTTIEFIPSTSAMNEDAVGMLPPVAQYEFSNEEYVPFINEIRGLTNQGWAISTASTDEEINSAVALFDHLYSEKGREEQLFGTEDFHAEGETFTGPDGVDYPKISDETFELADQHTDGNLNHFMKQYLGVSLQVGHQQNQGLEYQYTSESGLEADALYNSDTLVHPVYGGGEEHPMLEITPAQFIFTPQQQARLDNTNITLAALTNEILLYIYGSSAGADSPEELKEYFTNANVDVFEEVYQEAYNN